VSRSYEQRNERFFRFWAPFYDIIEWFVGGFRRKVVSMAGLRPGDRVLDVACGTGSLSFALESTGAAVTGVDISGHMLRVARKKLRRLERKRRVNLTFIEHDARQLPFPDANFDAATISFALHDMPQDAQVAVLREMKRVTKPSGSVIVADYRRPSNALGRTLAHLFISSYETRYYRQFVKRDLIQALLEAGLSVSEERRIINGMGRILRCAR
jgi:ubiquinone/menaquinone biosynthesis C-methylase UbiE